VTAETCWLLSAEIVLVASAVAVYLGGTFVELRRSWSWVAGAGLVAAGALLALSRGTSGSGAVIFDPLSLYVRWLALGAGGLLVLAGVRPEKLGTPEYVGSLLLVLAGLMLVAGAGDLVLLFVSLELISIPTYILLYLGRRDTQNQEAAAKYFFLSVLSSAILLYGFAFLYGATGATNLESIRAVFAQATLGPAAASGPIVLGRLALLLIFAGLSFKAAAVPFHFYAPDVYQGTTHSNAALLSVVPKAAGLVALVRLAAVALPGLEGTGWRVAAALALLTMTVGNVLALWQDNLRRLLAYSSVAHAGYMLIALAVAVAAGRTIAGESGQGALLFYLAVYAAATIGAFAAFECLGRRERPVNTIDELAGLGQTRPAAAAMIAVFMFSLAGVPPLAGFWGKLGIFASALRVDDVGPPGNLRAWFIGLAVVGVLNAAVAAAYYLRVVAVMYFRTPLATPEWRRLPAAAVVCAVLVLGIGLYPGLLWRAAASAGVATEPGAAVDGVQAAIVPGKGLPPSGPEDVTRASRPAPPGAGEARPGAWTAGEPAGPVAAALSPVRARGGGSVASVGVPE